MFVAFARDLTVRVFVWGAPFLALVWLGLSRGLETRAAPLTILAAVIIVCVQHARGLGKNLSWLHVVPISRARLWWLNVACALYASILTVVLACVTVVLFANQQSTLAVATASSSGDVLARHVEVFGNSLVPYWILLVVLAQGLLVQPLGGTPSFGVLAPENAFIVVALLALVAPRTPLVSGFVFLAFVATVAHFGTRASIVGFRLPRVSARRFLWRYWTATAILGGLGVFFVS